MAWVVEVFRAASRACRGLVACVCEGQTKNYRYSCGPLLLAADLHRAGFNLRKPPLYVRDGIPGSGGPDWLKNRYEFVVCTTRPGRLPWSDNTALGRKPKFPPGGPMSCRTADGRRVNARTGYSHTKRKANGVLNHDGNGYFPPELANPGNLIDCGPGGGGHMGSECAHENEAPFPEKLAEFFALSFCPPGGLACDPFSGSGTTGAVAVRHGRRFVGCDLRQSQVDLSLKRIGAETPLGLFSED